MQLKLCQTREYSPQAIEHWLHTIQSLPGQRSIAFMEKKGKVEIHSSEDLSPHLPGSRSIETSTPEKRGKYSIKQSKGYLLPIKRYSQFEDRVQKTRIAPTDTLFKKMAVTEASFLIVKFKAIPERKRRRVLKKAKQAWFQPERLFDQWETYGWFRFSWRRIFGPIFRKTFSHLQKNAKEVKEQTQSLHEREDPKSAILDKLSRPNFEVEIQLSHKFDEFINGFTLPYLGALKTNKADKKMILSAEELASILSPPSMESMPFLHTENSAYFAEPKNALEFSEKDRRRHLYLLGKTGMGKSSTLLKIFQQDLKSKNCVILIDPHGDLIEDALSLIPNERGRDIILLDPSNLEFPLALNPIANCEFAHLKASALVEMFKALAKGSWGPRLEYILRNTLLSLIEASNTTLLDLPRILTNTEKCRELISQTNNFELKRFWNEEFLNLNQKTRQEHIAPILNKVGPLLTSPILRNIFAQPINKIDFQKITAGNKIVLINLAKGKLGEDVSNMLGMIFISMIQEALLRRATLLTHERSTVALTIDEFQNFATPTLISMLSEARKYGLALTLANQYLTQLPPEIQDAVLGNVGSLFIFRTSFQDAEKLGPNLNLAPEDLTQLAPFKTYGKCLKNGELQPLFRLDIPKIIAKPQINTKKVKEWCAKRYGRPRQLVETKLKKRYNAFKSTPKNEENHRHSNA